MLLKNMIKGTPRSSKRASLDRATKIQQQSLRSQH
jgi:hypothetical protein